MQRVLLLVGSFGLALLFTLTAAGGRASAAAKAKAQAAGSNGLIGSWQRTNSCNAFVTAMRRAGLASGLPEWLAGGGYFQSPGQIDRAAPCKGARNAKHSHFFTRAGAFGSRDEKGEQVDDGGYKITARRTLAFPSHAREFGYGIKVRYRIDGGKLRFNVVVPHPCTGKCRAATAWAISAFYAGPAFVRGK